MQDPLGAPAVPDNSIIDPVSGYNVLIAAIDQGYPYWWRAQPEAYQSFLETRKRHGIQVEDGIEAFEQENDDY